jgi:hypothetical protein
VNAAMSTPDVAPLRMHNSGGGAAPPRCRRAVAARTPLVSGWAASDEVQDHAAQSIVALCRIGLDEKLEAR